MLANHHPRRHGPLRSTHVAMLGGPKVIPLRRRVFGVVRRPNLSAQLLMRRDEKVVEGKRMRTSRSPLTGSNQLSIDGPADRLNRRTVRQTACVGMMAWATWQMRCLYTDKAPNTVLYSRSSSSTSTSSTTTTVSD